MSKIPVDWWLLSGCMFVYALGVLAGLHGDGSLIATTTLGAVVVTAPLWITSA